LAAAVLTIKQVMVLYLCVHRRQLGFRWHSWQQQVTVSPIHTNRSRLLLSKQAAGLQQQEQH
jgi:hypothetical protein